MHIVISEYTSEDIEYFLSKEKTIVHKTPSNGLINLFIIEMITNYLFIRAEHDYSIENVNNIPLEMKKLNNFNPVYKNIVNLINNTIKHKNIESLELLYIFISEFIKKYKDEYALIHVAVPVIEPVFKKYDLSKIYFHIKLARSLQETLNYLVSKYF